MSTRNQHFVAQALASKYRVPTGDVEYLLIEETEAMSRQARITTYVSILAARRVEERLRSNIEALSKDRRRAA